MVGSGLCEPWVHGDLAKLSTCAKPQGGAPTTNAEQNIPEIIPDDADGLVLCSFGSMPGEVTQ